MYTFWHVPFEVTVSSGCWCSVLGSDLCTGYNDPSVPVVRLNLIKFEWMVGSVVSEVWWLFDLVCQRFQWLYDSICHRFQWLFDSVHQRFQLLIDSVMIIPEIDDWLSVIGWCRCISWFYCSGDWFWASMLLIGPVWKLDETWPSYGIVVYQEYLVWKFMKRGPWRILRVGAFSEEVEASYQ